MLDSERDISFNTPSLLKRLATYLRLENCRVQKELATPRIAAGQIAFRSPELMCNSLQEMYLDSILTR